MKKNLTLKLIASAAVVATVAPIISLASCSNKSKPFEIDPTEKTKKIEKGERQVVYTIKVDGLNSGETFFASVTDATSTQQNWKVAVTKAVEYDAKTSTALVTVDIINSKSENELIEDGTEFEFSLNIEKFDAQGKSLASAKFSNFKLVYGVPYTHGLILQGNARTYSDPGSPTHTYLYSVNPTLEVDSDCEFECDVEKKYEGSTPEVNIKFDSAKYDTASGSILVKFLLYCSIRDVGEGDIVNFSYTLSCKKNGKELWRQQFDDYQIEFLNHVMWIAKDYQDTQTYAGEKQFNLYILKNEFISSEMLESDTIKLDVTEPTNAGVTLTWDKTTITTKQYQSEIGVLPYFEVPVTINGDVADNTLIKYNATLQGYIGGGKTTQTFNDLQIRYWAQKATEPATKTAYLSNVKQHEFNFTLNNALEYDQTLTCEFIKTSGQSSKTTGTTTINVSGTNVKVNVAIDTDQLRDTIGFTLRLVCKNSSGVVWEQNSTGYSITTYVSAQIKEPQIVVKSEDPSQNVIGSIQIDLCGALGTTEASLTDGQILLDDNQTKVTNKTDSHIKESTFILKKPDSGMPQNKLFIEVTLVPEQNGILSDESKTNFDFTIGGKIKLGDDSVKDWTMTFTNLEVRYDVGKLKWEDGWYVKECIKDRMGNTYSDTINAEFSLTSALAQGQKLEAKTELASGSSTGYEIQLMDSITVESTKVLIPMRLAKSDSSTSREIYFGDHVFYNITISCKDADGKIVWEQKVNDCYIYALANFVIADKEKTKKSKIPTNFDVSHTVSIPTSRTGFKFETYIDNIKRSAGAPETVSVEPSESLKVRDENHSTQVVRWVNTTGMKDNEYVTFDMHVKVTFTQYLYDPVSYTFDFTDLKMIFATEE